MHSTIGGALSFNGLRQLYANTAGKKNKGSQIPALNIALVSATEAQNFLVLAQQNENYSALKSFIEQRGFRQSSVEGARAIVDSTQETLLLTEIFTNTEQPDIVMQLTFAKPYEGDNTAFAISFGADKLPLVAYYRRPDGIINVEFPPTVAAPPLPTDNTIYLPLLAKSSVSSTKSVLSSGEENSTNAFALSLASEYSDCTAWCGTIKNNFVQSANICTWTGYLTCLYLGALALPLNALIGFAGGAICSLIFTAACPLIQNATPDCDKSCADLNCSNSTPPGTTCYLGQVRAVCGDKLCSPGEVCGRDASGKELCTLPGKCQPNDKYMGLYKFGSKLAPACCPFDGLNCGAVNDGRWGGCCPKTTACCPEKGGEFYSCRFRCLS